ncbi:hypothetical protein D3C81_1603320 [compost metagenome]
MRTEERDIKHLVKVTAEDSVRCSIIYSDVFAERKKKKEYKIAMAQILERAKKLDW